MTASANSFAESRQQRVGSLTLRSNPAPDQDLLVRFEAGRRLVFADTTGGTARPDGDAPVTTVWVGYVPDRLIIANQGFHAYLDGLEALSLETPEALTAIIIDDLMDELVPRWISVVIDCGGHRVTMQDGQPHWSNPTLLTRLW